MPLIIYCTYLTVYSGNKLPPFYIGYSTVKNINKGYHGSVYSKKYKTIWQQELKSCPERFKTTILTFHETKQNAVEQELKFQRQLKVIKNPLYINQSVWPYVNNKGIKKPWLSERMRTNNPMKNPILVESMRRTKIGKPSWNKGIHHSQKTIEKIRQKATGRKNPIQSLLMKGNYRGQRSTAIQHRTLVRCKKPQSVFPGQAP
jgi:hypothetical protein